MDSLFAFVAAHISALVPVVPYVVALCLVYLIGNDALDVALAEKKDNGKASLNALLYAIGSDVASRQVLAAAGPAVLLAVLAGGDLKAQVVAGLVAVAVANVKNLESSTRQKLYTLLS